MNRALTFSLFWFACSAAAQDFDTDGTPDATDKCAAGSDAADADGDGTPNACDCAPNNSAIHRDALDVCDGVDNNCDARIDRHAPISVAGGELRSRIASGRAAIMSPRALSTVSALSGTWLHVGPSPLANDIYYWEPVDLETVGGRREVDVVFMRAATAGDNDFQVSFTDGWNTIVYSLLNGDTPDHYVAAAEAGISYQGIYYPISSPLLATPNDSFDDVGAVNNNLGVYYWVTFAADAEGTRVSLRSSRGLRRDAIVFPGDQGLDPNLPWQFQLIGNSPAETYDIQRIELRQPIPAAGAAEVDADQDGYSASCDCDDQDATVSPGAVERCDGRDSDCRVQAFEELDLVYGGTGGDIARDAADFLTTLSGTGLQGQDLTFTPPGGSSEQFYLRRELPITTLPAGELVVHVEVDRVPAIGTLDVGFASGGRTFSAGLAENDALGNDVRLDAIYGGDLGTQRSGAQNTLGSTVQGAGPYLLTFRFTSTSASVSVRTSAGNETSLTFAPAASVPNGPLSLVLVSRPSTSYRLRSIYVSRATGDADGDGLCDARDLCAGFDGDVDIDDDGFPDGCDCNDANAGISPYGTETCDGVDQDCGGQDDLQRLAGGMGSELAPQIARGEATGPRELWTAIDERTTTMPFAYESGYRKPLGVVQRADGVTMLRMSVNLGGNIDSGRVLAISDGTRAIDLDVWTNPTSTDVFLGTRVEGSMSPSWHFFGGSGPACTYPWGPHLYSCTWGAVQGFAGATFDDRFEVVFIADANGQRVVAQTPWSGYYYVGGYSALPQGNVAVLQPGSFLNLTQPITAYVYGDSIVEATVDTVRDDEDNDFQCDARDVCPAQDDALDGDLDGVPDACDLCLGGDGVLDDDQDGWPSGCDCDDHDALRHPTAVDACNAVDDDCDTQVDVDTLLSVRGSELSSRLLRGEATGRGARKMWSFSGGQAMHIAASSSAPGDVIYRERLGAVTPAAEVRLSMRFDRDAKAGDNDFAAALSDGASVFAFTLQNAGDSSGAQYLARAFVASDGASQELTSIVYGEERLIIDAPPYDVDFVLGADPRLEVRPTRGPAFTLRPAQVGTLSALNLQNLQALLVGEQANQTYAFRSLSVRQALPDADADTVCDAVDRVPGGDDLGLDSDGDGIADVGDVCAFGDDDDDADGDDVPDACDICPGSADGEDRDGDLLPDACDACPDDYANDNDGDSVCDLVDVCFGFDDLSDGDGDSVPDGCDDCPLDAAGDSDEDGSCDSADVCTGSDRSGDLDGDGVCADQDCDDTRGSVRPGADEVCDGFDSDCDGAMGPREVDDDGDGTIDCLVPLVHADAGPHPVHDAGTPEDPPDDTKPPGCGCAQGDGSSPGVAFGAVAIAFAAVWRRGRRRHGS